MIRNKKLRDEKEKAFSQGWTLNSLSFPGFRAL